MHLQFKWDTLCFIHPFIYLFRWCSGGDPEPASGLLGTCSELHSQPFFFLIF